MYKSAGGARCPLGAAPRRYPNPISFCDAVAAAPPFCQRRRHCHALHAPPCPPHQHMIPSTAPILSPHPRVFVGRPGGQRPVARPTPRNLLPSTFFPAAAPLPWGVAAPVCTNIVPPGLSPLPALCPCPLPNTEKPHAPCRKPNFGGPAAPPYFIPQQEDEHYSAHSVQQRTVDYTVCIGLRRGAAG